MSETCARDRSDLLSKRLTSLLLWWVPITALIATAVLDISSLTRTLAWTVSLLMMGVACLFNASRCGRVHCYFTGPFFLLLAVASFLHGLGMVSLGPHGWGGLGITLLVGAFILAYLPERIWGKYFSDK